MAKRDRKGGPENDNGAPGVVKQSLLDEAAYRRDETLVCEAGPLLKRLADAETFAYFDKLDAGYKPAGVFKPGDRVRMTATALHSMYGTWRIIAADAAKTWTVVECRCDLCESPRVVAVDELVALDECAVVNRHISAKALRHAGQPYGDELLPSTADADMAAIQRGLRAGLLRH